jgi:hypothetical protein
VGRLAVLSKSFHKPLHNLTGDSETPVRCGIGNTCDQHKQPITKGGESIRGVNSDYSIQITGKGTDRYHWPQ